jgi:hypothetical protein
MMDRPIVFSAPMVLALLDGRKTQTRRLLKPQPPERPPANCHPTNTATHAEPYLDAYCGEPRTHANPRGMSRIWHWWQVDDRPDTFACKVQYAPGDRLWVREAWKTAAAYDDLAPSEMGGEEPKLYDADKRWDANGWPPPSLWGRYRHARFMPRWASRLTLSVTDVRVQRLQEISEADAEAEGVKRWGLATWKDYTSDGTTHVVLNCRHSFCTLWNNLHGPGAWGANPWIAAYTFEVHNCNIDAMERNAL